MDNRVTIVRNGQRITLVALLHTNPWGGWAIEHYALVRDGNSATTPRQVFSDTAKDRHGLGVEVYKRSSARGLFAVVTYAEVIKCNQQLLAAAGVVYA
jgi:hypothetical protein